MAETLYRLYRGVEDLDRESARLRARPPEDVIDGGDRQRLDGALGRFRDLCYVHGFDATADNVVHVQSELRQSTNKEVCRDLRRIRDHYLQATEQRLVYVIDPARTDLYMRPAPRFTREFPSSTPEVEAAWKCYALGQPTAAVFHAMRGVECGLRELAVCSGMTNPKVAIEVKCWHEIIQTVESNYKKATNQWPKSPEKSEALAFFGATIADLYRFKDDVRNVVMHARAGSLYDAPDALSVLKSVSAWMERLAAKISEGCRVNLLDLAGWRA